MRRAVVIATALMALAFYPNAQAQHFPKSVGPFILLEKTRFALTEEVFFWVGQVVETEPRGHMAATCQLTTTRPDGTEKVETIDMTAGGGIQDPVSRGGGHRWGPALQIGRYVLALECGALFAPPASLMVEDVPILKDIDMAFEFSSPLALASPDATVTLVVRNRSSQAIRFPHRGEMFEPVGVGLTRTTGEKWVRNFAFPAPALLAAGGVPWSNIGEFTFTWALTEKVPTVVLAPGETYRLKVPLAEALASVGAIPVGDYDLRVSTVLQMLIGDRDGPWADFAPVRLEVASVAHGTQP